MLSRYVQSVPYLETRCFEVDADLRRCRVPCRDDASLFLMAVHIRDNDDFRSKQPNRLQPFFAVVEPLVDELDRTPGEDPYGILEGDSVFRLVAPVLVWIPSVAHRPYGHNVCTTLCAGKDFERVAAKAAHVDALPLRRCGGIGDAERL